MSGTDRVPHPTAFRLVLGGLAAVQLVNGLWALLAPRSFYGDFPFGRGWVEALPAYNEHLMRDVGGLFLATAVLLGAAALWPNRRLVAVALIAWLAFAVPHTVYHLFNLGVHDFADALANVLTLGATVLFPVALLVLLARGGRSDRPGAAGTAAGAGPAGAGSRIAGVPESSRNPLVRLAYRSSRRRTGTVMEPIAIFAHHPKLLAGYGTLELAAERSGTVPERLKHLAEVRAGMLVGCEWCLDFGSSVSEQAGVGEEDLRALPAYRDSDRFSELEKLALDYATGMSRTPAEVDEETFEGLRRHLDEAQLVELTALIALENFRARFNWAFGMEGQGFSEGAYCVRPEPAAPPG